jgi:hypothetical protein
LSNFDDFVDYVVILGHVHEFGRALVNDARDQSLVVVAIGSTVWSMEGNVVQVVVAYSWLGRAPVVFPSDLKNWRSIRGDTDTLKMSCSWQSPIK